MDGAWLGKVSDEAEAAELTTRLVARRSYPGEEGAVQQVVAEWLTDHGLAPEVRDHPTARDRPNVVARIANGPGPTLLLNGHVDTVLEVDGWSSDPWRARRDGDRLIGLGACDMKAGVAAAMLVARALHRHRDHWRGTLQFSSVVDEEALSLGARALIADGLRADACVVVESSWRPCLGSVGKVLARVEVRGRAAHAAWPATGVNAVVEAARFVAGLDGLPLGDHPRLTASRCVLGLHGGNQQYVITVPEHARVVLNRMIVPGESAATVATELQDLVARLASPAAFEVVIDPPFYPPWETDPDHPLARRFALAYAAETGASPDWAYTGFGDANLFAGEADIPTIQFGPHGANFHQADEWVDVPSIGATIRVLLRLAIDLMPSA